MYVRSKGIAGDQQYRNTGLGHGRLDFGLPVIAHLNAAVSPSLQPGLTFQYLEVTKQMVFPDRVQMAIRNKDEGATAEGQYRES